MPITHIALYAQILEDLLNEYKARDLLTDEFKTIAAVEIEMKKLQKLVIENYALNSMKGSVVNRIAVKFWIKSNILNKLNIFIICSAWLGNSV